MKIALCMSGHARTYAQTFETWRDNLLAHHDVDVFFHVWDTLGPRTYGRGAPGHSGIEQSELLNLDHLINIWHPTLAIMDKYVYFHQHFDTKSAKWYRTREALGLRDIDRPLGNMSMYYKWRECNNLRLRHAEQHNITYDMVIRSRPDIALREQLPAECFHNNSVTYIPIAGSWAENEISDYITLGTSEQLNHWCSIYDQLDEKYTSALESNDFTKALYPHKLFYHHFVDHNQPFKQVPINCEIIR